MEWLRGGYGGLDKDGNERLINFMPRSLRWYIWLCKYKLYIYATAGVIILLSAFCLGMGVYSYKTYTEQVAKYEQIQMDEQSKQIRDQYHAMEDTMSRLLQHGSIQ